MTKRRLFIFICVMLICVTLVGCGTNSASGNISESETELECQRINSSVVTKYSEKEIIVYSDTTCFFNLRVKIRDGEFRSENKYGEFKISEGEFITLHLEDFGDGFFSDNAIIEDVETVTPYIYGNSALAEENYKKINCSLLLKYSSKEIIIQSDKKCLFDLFLSAVDNDFNSTNYYRRIEINEGETLTLTLDDLAPGLFSDNAQITYINSYIDTYVEK